MLAQERAAQRAERHTSRLTALLSVGRIMGVETSLQAVFDAVVSICRDAFACDNVTLMLLDRQANELEIRAASGETSEHKSIGTRVQVGQGVAGAVALKGQPVVLGSDGPRGSDYPGWEPHQRKPSAAMIVPITVRDELVGVLNVTSYTPEAAFDDQDLQSLRVFAENVGTCIRHAEQAEWMRQLIQRHDAAARSAAEVR
jgi:transcriptional regulator with GAF, ATPase, and Fis domain